MEETNIILGDGFIIVSPDFPESLLKKLRYWRKVLDWSNEKLRRVTTGFYEELYTVKSYINDEQKLVKELITMPGFAYTIKNHLKNEGWSVKVVDNRTKLPTPDFEKAFVGLREYQIEPVYIALMSGGGIISAPTGWGKTRLISAIINAYSPEELKLRGTPISVIAAPDKDITLKNYNELVNLLSDRDVGIVMSGYNKFSDDVQCITLDSLHRLNYDDVGILIVDEVHTAASDRRSDLLLQMRKALRWGVSATPTGRFDGRDLVTEGIFGPIIYSSTYNDGVKSGALVPITVVWVECPEPVIGLEKYERYSTRAGRYRHAVWRHPLRNKLIADILRLTPNTMQTLCIMQYLEHMNEIVPLCDNDVNIVHGETNSENIAKYKNLYAISSKERKEIYTKMETGEIKKILSTYVYKQGVNFPNLEVVINAGGGGSEIISKQIPGRESRKTENKERSYLIDFYHPWDWVYDTKTGKRKFGPVQVDDKSRERSYKQLEFEQIWIRDITQLPYLTKR